MSVSDEQPTPSPDIPYSLAPSIISYDIKRDIDTAHKPTIILREKVVIVGDETVGKTSLVQMFVSGGQDYPKNYVMTVGVEFCVKEVQIPDTDVFVDLFLNDMAGQSIFNQRELPTRLWKHCNYIVCVFDVSSRKSLQSCAKWIQSVRSANSHEGRGMVPGILVGNKTDLREGGMDSRSEVDTEEGLKFAQENGLEYFECSSCLGRDVNRPFHFIASQSFQKFQKSRQEFDQES